MNLLKSIAARIWQTPKGDGYHSIQELKDHVRALGGIPAQTMDELYLQRSQLSIEFFNRQPGKKWKFVSEPGWFGYGVELPNGSIGYHAPIEFWDDYDAPETEPVQTDANTLERLVAFRWGNQFRFLFDSLK